MKNVEEILDVSIKAIKIEVQEEERQRLLQEISRLKEWLNPFLELETGDPIPGYYPFKAVNAFREDIPSEAENVDRLTVNSYTYDGEYYRIPRVVEE